MRVSGAGVSADLVIPLFCARLRGANNFLGESGMPGFPRIFPLVRISKADFGIANQNKPVRVAVEMSLGEFLLILWNVFIPNLWRFVDVAVTIKHREVLFPASSLIRHVSSLAVTFLLILPPTLSRQDKQEKPSRSSYPCII